MTNELVKQEHTQDQIDLIKSTICKGATDDELKLFLYTSQRMGLDPLSGQIHGLKRWDGGKEKLTIQVGIDGFRLIADRTKERSGEDDPEWCGEDGKWKDVWLSPKPPLACRVRIYRKGHQRPYSGIAYWKFYVQTKKDGSPNHMWAKGGPNMLAKCAEALALRKAFPAELSGVYTSEEMGQAANPTPENGKTQPSPAPYPEPIKQALKPITQALETSVDLENLKTELVRLTNNHADLLTKKQRDRVIEITKPGATDLKAIQKAIDHILSKVPIDDDPVVEEVL